LLHLRLVAAHNDSAAQRNVGLAKAAVNQFPNPEDKLFDMSEGNLQTKSEDEALPGLDATHGESGTD
jgi:hypothetical protein